MCGITGFIDTGKNLEELQGMTTAIKRRGPDDAGTYMKDGVGLGHRRLSIIDLSDAGHQPMRFNDLVTVFNGEIYNYKDIQRELRGKGYDFTTSSDTEVVLKAFHCWGAECVQHFIGMFAIAIYNESDKKLHLFRDRAGVKPLYYHYSNGKLAFGSELKCFKYYLDKDSRKKLNLEAISEFFTHGYISGDLSVLADVKRLPPAHYMVFDAGRISLSRYWDVTFKENKSWLTKKEDDLLDELEELVISSFKYRMVADVPVGVFLSAGVDSSLVAAVLSKHYGQINTFTIGFKEKDYDESENAAKIAKYLNTNHTTEFLLPEKAFDILDHFYDIFDEPHGDNSCVPTTFVSEVAKSAGMKVVLSADAGDELFGGYSRYPQNVAQWQKLNKFGKAGMIAASKIFGCIASVSGGGGRQRFERFKDIAGSLNFIDFYQYIIRITSAAEAKRVFPQYTNPLFEFNNNTDINSQMMEWDFKRYMTDDILVKVDRATMYNSIEGREPFLDHRLVEFAAQMPVELKFKGGETKYLLKKLLGRYLPDELFRLPKKGFGAPLQLWMKDHFKAEIQTMLDNNLFKNDYLDLAYTGKILRDFVQGKPVNSIMVWYIYSFQKWYNNWNAA